jgi:hypothetical protein
MRACWSLPDRVSIGGREYPIHCDYRDILEIFSYFLDPDIPDYFRWRIALALFYEGEIDPAHYPEAMDYLARFISGGKEERGKPGPTLMDWEQDSELIVADVNKAAGQEIRALPFLHWWSFLSFFNAIGEGRLSEVVSIRNKLARGKKLEDWEKEFYREHKDLVNLRKRHCMQELQARQRLERMLE